MADSRYTGIHASTLCSKNQQKTKMKHNFTTSYSCQRSKSTQLTRLEVKSCSMSVLALSFLLAVSVCSAFRGHLSFHPHIARTQIKSISKPKSIHLLSTQKDSLPIASEDNTQSNKLDENDTHETIDEKVEEEVLFRKYPFGNTQLPILPDCDNYFSGKYKDYFWNQNADQVYVYIPIDDSVDKNDVTVKFDVQRVEIKVKGEIVTSLKFSERLIPAGSFWIFERDNEGRKYLQLDIEKRFRMFNWKGVFSESASEKGATEDADSEANATRKKMLEALFAANKGMSKLHGGTPESIEDMMANEQLMKMISVDGVPLSDSRPLLDTLDDFSMSDPDAASMSRDEKIRKNKDARDAVKSARRRVPREGGEAGVLEAKTLSVGADGMFDEEAMQDLLRRNLQRQQEGAAKGSSSGTADFVDAEFG